MLTQIAPAKINLFLHVTGRRADGYHLLDSLVVFASIADRLTVATNDELTLEVFGPTAEMAGPPDENLVLRAAKVLRNVTGTRAGARMSLEKQIPAGAGLGGGSSDAATALRLLNAYWRCGLDDDQLSAIGLELGADIPVCLRRRPTRMRGIGEELEDIGEFPDVPVVLIHPGGQLATKDVFARLNHRFGKADSPAPKRIRDLDTLVTWLAKTRNDLEAPAIELRPDIAAAIDAIRSQKDCIMARMSGSGAASFGLFLSPSAAQHASERLQEYHPNWWIRHGFITTLNSPKS